MTGGRYEESNFASTGSGSLHAGTVIKIGFREGLARQDALDLAINALFTAADDDSATGGPDLVRGIYPTMATITSAGFERVTELEIAERFGSLIEVLATREGLTPPRIPETVRRLGSRPVMSMPFYVAPEQVMKDRADYARKGIARGRSLVAAVYDQGILICAENPSSTLRKVRRSTTASPSPGWASTTSSTSCASPACAPPTSRATPTAARTSTPAAWPTSTPPSSGQIFTHEMKPMEVEILVAEVGATRTDDRLFHILYDGTVMDEESFTVLGGEAEAINTRLTEAWNDDFDLAGAMGAAVVALAGADRTLGAEELEAAVLERTDARRAFRRLELDERTALLG